MFGKNIVLKPVWNEPFSGHPADQEEHSARISGQELAVKDFFPTIQGEGPNAGEPAIFIRLAGCNLRCHFCDTDFENGVPRRIDEIMAAVEVMREQYPEISLIVLTGGEPLRQQIIPLCCALDEAGFITQIETAGTLWPPETEAGAIAGHPERVSLTSLCKSGAVQLVCSPKTPELHQRIVELCEHFKYIVRAGEVDERGLPNQSTQIEGRPAKLWGPHPDNAFHHVWLQPCFEYAAVPDQKKIEGGVMEVAEMVPDAPRLGANQAECVKQAMKHGHRISMQLHKLLGIE